MLERFNPDIYSDRDAKDALLKIKDKTYSLGGAEVNTRDLTDKAKIWSLSPRVLQEVVDIVDEAGHYHLLPFIMGNYHMDSRKMRMNDISILSDPVTLLTAINGGIDRFGLPLRGLYFVGRRGWWRHESIHARHHLQMSSFLEERENPSRLNYPYSSRRLDEAVETIHESGIEELLTRWQSLKESRGPREKGVSALAMLLYMEYASFTGFRNMFIDAKEVTLDRIQGSEIRIPAKFGAIAVLIAAPIVLDNQIEWRHQAGELIDTITPLTTDQAKRFIDRGLTYVDVAAISALFSSKEKGAFGDSDELSGNRMSTKEYKFPYTYSPATAITRSIGFSQYLNRVWDEIPHFRVIESPRDAEALKREIEGRVEARLGDRQASFTMNVVEDALGPTQRGGRSSFPKEVYLKGMFIPAMYLKMAELYKKPEDSSK